RDSASPRSCSPASAAPSALGCRRDAAGSSALAGAREARPDGTKEGLDSALHTEPRQGTNARARRLGKELLCGGGSIGVERAPSQEKRTFLVGAVAEEPLVLRVPSPEVQHPRGAALDELGDDPR